MKSNDKILLAILWPFAGLITSLKHWRQPWAMNMFWVVCMYLGAIQIYHPEGTVLGDGADSGRYVLQLMDMYNNVHSFSDVSKYFYDGSTIDVDSTIQTQQNIPEGVYDFNDLLKALSSIAFKSGLETGDINYSAREATLNPNVPYTNGMTVKDILRKSSYLMYKSNLNQFDIKSYKSDGYLASASNLEDILLMLKSGTFRRRRLTGNFTYSTATNDGKTTGVMQYKIPLSDYDSIDIDEFDIIDAKLYISGKKYYDRTFICNLKQGPSGGPSHAELHEYNYLPGFSSGTYGYRISFYVENNYFIFEVSCTNPVFIDALSSDMFVVVTHY